MHVVRQGITDDSLFINRVLNALRAFMEEDGQHVRYAEFVAPASRTVRFAKPLDRSVIGSLSELVREAITWLEGGEVSPHDVGFKLNDTLLSALATGKSDKYGSPNEAFKLLVEDVE